MKARGIYMSQSGFNRAQETLARKSDELAEIQGQRALAFAQSGDGWHDNPHFNYLQQMEAEKSRDIATLAALLAVTRVVAVDPANRPVDAVRLGSVARISIRPCAGGAVTEETWEVTGHDETDLPRHCLAYNSPLGSALIGMEEGDEFEITPASGPSIVTVEELYVSSPVSSPQPGPSGSDSNTKCMSLRTT